MMWMFYRNEILYVCKYMRKLKPAGVRKINVNIQFHSVKIVLTLRCNAPGGGPGGGGWLAAEIAR
jgi:hypothetical protein